MTLVLIEASLRSLLAGLVVAIGLRVFRVHNVVAQKAAWGLVLTAALAMPLLLPTVGRSQLLPASVSIPLPAHPMTLLEELQARILARNPAGRMPKPAASAVPQDKSKQDEESASPAPETGRAAPDKESQFSAVRSQNPVAPKEAIAYSASWCRHAQLAAAWPHRVLF